MSTPPRQPVVVLISGRGSNMQTLVEHSHVPGNTYEIVRVVSDMPQAAGLGVARDLGVASLAVPRAAYATAAEFELALGAAIDDAAPTLIALAGFMRILSAGFVERYAARMLNIHPSLLPRYRGLHTHRRVLAAGDAEHGATVHFVTPELDGGPLVLQATVPVLEEDDEATLAARVQRQEHQIYPLAVSWYTQGRLRCHDAAAWLDGARLTAPVRFPC